MTVLKKVFQKMPLRVKIFYPVMILAALCIGNSLQAQQQAEEFIPHGSPFVKVFFNYNTKIYEGKGTSAFELQRAYLGYNYYFSKSLSLTANSDAGNPKNNSEFYYTLYLKNAFLSYNKNDWGINLGLINTKNFKVQEDFWGYRFVEKSAQDQYKMSPSADLGISISRKLGEKVEADVTARNGEGYKSIQLDNYFYYGAGLTIKPDTKMLLRFYYEVAPEVITRTAFSAFAGYTWDHFRIGAEYNLDSNEKFTGNQNLSAVSAYAAYRLSQMLELFFRYDNLTSLTGQPFNIPGPSDSLTPGENPWNIANDGRQILAGLQYSPVKGVKTALNYKGWKPADSSRSITSTIYANFEFSFK